MAGKTRSASPEAPQVSTVFRGENGMLHHARCGGVLSLQGSRGGIELDFYCFTCPAHVTIPEIALARIPTLSASAAQLLARPLTHVPEIDEPEDTED